MTCHLSFMSSIHWWLCCLWCVSAEVWSCGVGSFGQRQTDWQQSWSGVRSLWSCLRRCNGTGELWPKWAIPSPRNHNCNISKD